MVILTLVVGIFAFPIAYNVFFLGSPSEKWLHLCKVGYGVVMVIAAMLGVVLDTVYDDKIKRRRFLINFTPVFAIMLFLAAGLLIAIAPV